MSEPTPRQVLYALVAGGFLLVVAALVIGAAIAGLVPAWWTVLMGALVIVIASYTAVNWRKTGLVLVLSIAAFVVWMIGTLALA